MKSVNRNLSESCPRCGTTADHLGCPSCGLLRKPLVEAAFRTDDHSYSVGGECFVFNGQEMIGTTLVAEKHLKAGNDQPIEMTLVEVYDPKSLAEMGAGTKWCTTRIDLAKQYLKKYHSMLILFSGAGSISLYSKHTKPLIQATPDLSAVFDSEDRPTTLPSWAVQQWESRVAAGKARSVPATSDRFVGRTPSKPPNGEQSGGFFYPTQMECHDMGLKGGGESAKADEHGIYTSDLTSELEAPDEDGEIGLPQEWQDSTSGEATDGITTKMGRGKGLGENDKMKNAGGGFQKMQENVQRLANAATKFLSEAAKEIGKAGNYKAKFSVSADGVKTRHTGKLTEAMTDAEELIQVLGTNGVNVEASFMDARGGIALHKSIPLVTITPRGAVTSEGVALFRYPIVAKMFSKQIVSEGRVCRIVSHNWGAAVKGGLTSNLVKKAFWS